MKKPSIKNIFQMAFRKLDDKTVYEVDPGDFEINRIRVDCAELGSFFVSYSEIEENYDSGSGQYLLSKTQSWQFVSLHRQFDGFPEISIEDGYKFLKGL